MHRASQTDSGGTEPSLTVGAVSTLAGSGLVGNTDGSGVAASFNAPAGVVVSGGTAYVLDTGALRTVNLSTGAVGTLATTGDTGSRIATDGTDIYSTYNDFCSYTVLLKTSIATGATSTLASGGFGDLTVGPDGDIYATSKGTCGGQSDGSVGDNSVYQIDPSTGAVTTWAAPASVESFFGIAEDSTDLWLTGQDTSSGHTRLLMKIPFSDPSAAVTVATGDVPKLALLSAGSYLYAGNFGGTQLRRYSKADGSWMSVAGTLNPGYQDGTAGNAWFASISEIATDGQSLYVADA
jgi:hypothetical protein